MLIMPKLTRTIVLSLLLLGLTCRLKGSTILGDCDNSGQVTRADVNELSRLVSRGDSSPIGDADRNGTVDDDDVRFLDYYVGMMEGGKQRVERSLLEMIMGHHQSTPEEIEGVIKECTKTSDRRRLLEFSDFLLQYLKRGGGSCNEAPFQLSIPARDIVALTLAAMYDRESRLLIAESASSERSRLLSIKSDCYDLQRLCSSYDKSISEGTQKFVLSRTEKIEENINSALLKANATPTAKAVDVSISVKEPKTPSQNGKEHRLPAEKSNKGLIIGFILMLVGGGIVGLALWAVSRKVNGQEKPTPPIDTSMTRGNRYFSIKKYDKAIREYQKVLESPYIENRTVVRLKLATAFAQLGRYELATVHVEQMDPSRGPLGETYDLARTFEEHGQNDLAQRLYESICARRQDFKDANKRLAELKEKTELINVFDPRLVERKFAPRYGTFSILGKGGMGVVFKAHDRQERKAVAIKVILPELANEDKFKKRFDREIDALARLEHPSIVNVIASGKEPLYHYVMEFVEGRPVLDLIANQVLYKKYEDVRTLARNLAEAMAYAHERGILHRDIKPANIVMLPDNNVKVLDFGVARVTDSTKLTVTGEFIGTLAYSAPELVYGAEATRASDVFSYGIILFELITGERPWTNEELMAGIDRQAIRAKDAAPDCPEDLAKTIDVCLQTDPKNRAQDFVRVLAMLEQ